LVVSEIVSNADLVGSGCVEQLNSCTALLTRFGLGLFLGFVFETKKERCFGVEQKNSSTGL